MIIGFGGKGGVGKTTVLTLLLDEVARRDYPGKVLVIDGDPAMTLAMSLGLEDGPLTTLADIRDSTPLTARQIRGLPPGVTPEQHVSNLLETQGCIARGKLREMKFDFMAMGHSEKPGCYCRINKALTGALNAIRQNYDLILIDNEAGLEHISRYRLTQIDLFALIMTQGQSSWAVANRLRYLIDDVGIQVGQIWQIYNRLVKTGRSFSCGGDEYTLFLPESDTIGAIDRQGGSPVYLVENHPLRLALEPIVTRIWGQVAEHSPAVLGVMSPDADAFAMMDVTETETEIVELLT
ncbi:MAG: AAA family ATPase [Chloroflexi bacterium]|nr:AAA family ATPase [Chloroflexota bacterium]